MKRVATIVAIFAAAAVIAAFTLVYASLTGPGIERGTDGIRDTVTIRFDDVLRPYVEATNLDDALFAEGWLHARYRLWQMELLRRAGRGRLAEGLGAALLETDRGLWKAGVPQLAARLNASADTATLESVDAYVAGINLGIDSYRVRPPEFLVTNIEPAPWSRIDVFAVAAMIAFDSANNMDNELLRLSLAASVDGERFRVFLPDETELTRDPDVPPGLDRPSSLVASVFADALDPAGQRPLPNASLGSSGWAVKPSRSASGNALFAFDSHDALSLPNLFYEVHLFYGPGKSIRGWSLPGLPGVINGYNERLAWGMTNIGDTQDLYIETRHPEDPLQFRRDGEWYRARTETITIPVKGREQDETLTIVHTANGPLINDDPPLALRWTGHDVDGRGLDTLLAMNTAGNWDEFERAVSRHAAPSANITYADMDGRVAFRTIGLLPVRSTGIGLVPQPGDASESAWQGYVQQQDLPQRVDPAQGYVAAANARVESGGPLISADNAPGYRIRRLHAVLSSRSDFTLADMQALQLDAFNEQAALLLPHMLDAIADTDDGTLAESLALLRAWSDYPVNTADSAGALIWEHWYPALAQAVFGAALDDALLARLLSRAYLLNHALDRLIVDDRDSPWWQDRREELLTESLRSAVTALAESNGSNPAAWRWDSAHSVSFRHELHGAIPGIDRWLSRGPYAWGGGNAVLMRARYRYDRPFEGRAGATVRVVVEMGETMNVQAIIPGGQHGHPSSSHYADQLPDWLDGELHNIPESPDGVSGDVTILSPLRRPEPR